MGTEFKGQTSLPIQAAFSANSKQLYVADQSGAVKVWRLPTTTASEPNEAATRRLNETAARRNAIENSVVLPPERTTARSSDRRWTASAPGSIGAYYLGGQGSFANRNPNPAEPPFEIKLEDISGQVPTKMLSLAAPAELLTFSPDGSFLVSVSIDESAKLNEAAELKVWNVVTGQELLSQKLLSTAGASQLSIGADQGTSTGLWSLPALAEAEGLVDWLSAADGDARFLTRSNIAEQIKTDPFVSAEARTIALKLASKVRRSAEALSTQALKILNSPNQPRDEYQQALDWINEAVEQDKENSSYANYQGIAYYRLGQYADALTALARSQELHAAQKLSLSAEDLTILAMAQHQAGQRDEARTTLEQARTSTSRNKLAGQKLLAEAESLLDVPQATDKP